MSKDDDIYKCVGEAVEDVSHKEECPYCHSTNIKKVSLAYRTVDLLLRGFYAMNHATSRWHCDDCGKEW